MLLSLHILTLPEFSSSRGVCQWAVWLGDARADTQCARRSANGAGASRSSTCLGSGCRLGSPATKTGWEHLAPGFSFPVMLCTEMQLLNISVLYFLKLQSVISNNPQASSLVTTGLQPFICYFPSYFIGIARSFQNPSLRKSSCYSVACLNSVSGTFLCSFGYLSTTVA